LQILLIGYGYSCGACGVDGDFGNDTDTAVKAFQRDMRISIDGVVGVNTWGKLLK
jgi:N-acetylmuramoyl-L-alanine amidase